MSSTTPSQSTQASPPLAPKKDVREAGAPFDDGDADLIVRSSDGVDFRVYKIILSKASQTFKDMFAAQPSPPSPSSEGDANFKSGLPIVVLTEPAQTLHLLLRLFYPIDQPRITGIADTRALLEAATKYMVYGLPNTLEHALLTAADDDPGTIYALACHHRLPRVASGSARRTLERSNALSAVSDADLGCMTGLQYRRLLQYREACVVAAAGTVQKFTWADGADIPGAVAEGSTLSDRCTCFRARRIAGKAPGRRVVSHYYLIPKWVLDYMAQCSAALKAKPCASVVQDAVLISTALEQAARCESCKPLAVGQLQKFTKKLAEEIDSAVTQVILPF